MFRSFLGAAILVASVPPAEAQSNLRTFFNPVVFGKPVAFCMPNRSSCGKPAADSWCREHGYGQALVFERLKTADKSQVFRQIKCITREEAVAARDGDAQKAVP